MYPKYASPCNRINHEQGSKVGGSIEPRGNLPRSACSSDLGHRSKQHKNIIIKILLTGYVPKIPTTQGGRYQGGPWLPPAPKSPQRGNCASLIYSYGQVQCCTNITQACPCSPSLCQFPFVSKILLLIGRVTLERLPAARPRRHLPLQEKPEEALVFTGYDGITHKLHNQIRYNNLA